MTKFKTYIKNIKESVVTLEEAVEIKRYRTAVLEAIKIQKTLTELVNKIARI